MIEISLDAVQTTALAVLLLLLGQVVKRRVGVLERFCIPAPVIGGFGMALLMLVFRETGLVKVTFNTALQTPFMVAFFTTVGIGGSIALLRTGGVILFIYLGVCWTVALFQNTFGPLVASLVGLDPVQGVMAGAVSLLGGHGGAAAFGPMAEQMGHPGSTTVAITAATFGLVSGSLLGGPLGAWLVRRHGVEIATVDVKSAAPAFHDHDDDVSVTSQSLIAMTGLVLVLMVIGALLSGWVQQATAFVLPAYVGAMVAAILARNLNDGLGLIRLNAKALDALSDLTLGVFLTMAMMTLKIWELYDLALPLMVVLAAQVLALMLLAAFVVFRLLGRNYDAAVMCAGLMGHGLGATPNAIANMSAMAQRFGLASPRALMIVPLCGAVLVDIVAIPFHAYMINILS